MDPVSEINRLDLQTVIDSVYGMEQQRVRNKILLGTATLDEIIANYQNRDPLGEVFEQDVTREEAALLMEHFDAIAYSNYLGGIALLHATSPTESALRDTESTRGSIDRIKEHLLPDVPLTEHIDYRIIDLHNAYAGVTNHDNIHLLDPASNQTRLIGAQSLRSGISDMEAMEPFRPVTPHERLDFNLALEAAGGIVFGSMLGLLAKRHNYDGSINRENLNQLLQTVKLYAGPTLSQTNRIFETAQKRDFGIACFVLERAIKDCTTNDLKNALVKGDLHEVLWLMDAFALIKGAPEKYGQVGIVPADYAEDRGNIKNLVLRRGHDFRVYHRDTLRRSFVQLKSHNSLKNDKPYAEPIEVRRERDFHESIQKPSLFIDKLNLYYTWSQANFSTEMFKNLKLDRMVMPTVKEAFDDLL